MGYLLRSAIKFLYDLNIETGIISFNRAMITNKKATYYTKIILESDIGKELINIATNYKIYYQGFLGKKWNISEEKINGLIFIFL